MRVFSSREHLAAIALGLLMVLGLRIQDRPIQIISGWAGEHVPVVYAKYFPGLNRLEQHEIFAQENRDLKKIVFLGASAVHSVGCDYTWIPLTQSIRQSANVHYSCSVAEQFNDELARRGVKGWKAFNLAKAGGRLMPMMYVYARLLPLKPELVVYGDSFPYYMMSNAGAENLLSDDHAFLRKTFEERAETRALWGHFEDHLRVNGLSATPLLSPRNIAKSFLRLQPDSSASGVIGNLLTGPRNLYTELQKPLPLRYTMFRRWEASQSPLAQFDNPDPGFRYFEGVRLMSEMQKLNGGKLFFYYSPQFDRRDDVVYNLGLAREFGGYMNDNGIAHASLVDLPLKPVTETYDGDHQTVYGNRRIALALMDQLQAQGLVKQ